MRYFDWCLKFTISRSRRGNKHNDNSRVIDITDFIYILSIAKLIPLPSSCSLFRPNLGSVIKTAAHSAG